MHLNPFPVGEHVPLFLQGFGLQGSEDVLEEELELLSTN